MKIDRLIGILSVLLQKEKVTAPELAERFEVSRRTINRDIENLCRAGIPISTSQGAGGGIRIMEGYRMDRTLLTSKDMQMILAGVRSLDSVSGSHYYSQLMEKIKAGSSDYVNGSESILIDLSSWYKESLSGKIELVQRAIEEGKVISFRYYAPGRDSVREIEPYFLIFKWSSWYVWGWCRLREDFRMFKLNRMDQLIQTSTDVTKREVPMPDLSAKKIFPGNIRVKAVFDASMKWHLIETFGTESFQVLDDGRLLFEHEYTDKEALITWMLSCRDKVTVLEPESVREELLFIISEIVKRYETPKQDADDTAETAERQEESIMPRPRNKEDLILAAKTNYEKLLILIESRTESEKSSCYDFSADEKKKEAHWKRDKNLRDVLMHLHEWHLLLLAWIKNREDGSNKPFLMEGYNWKTYGAMNMVFFERCRRVSEEEALQKFMDSHRRVMEALDIFSDEELFTNTYYPWVGGSCIGSYFISTTSSHYDWAMKKIKAHKKICG